MSKTFFIYRIYIFIKICTQVRLIYKLCQSIKNIQHQKCHKQDSVHSLMKQQGKLKQANQLIPVPLLTPSLGGKQNKVCHLALQNTPLPSQFVAKILAVQKYWTHEHSIKFWTNTVALNTAIQCWLSSLWIIKLSVAAKSAALKIQSRQPYSDYMSPMTLALMTAKQYFCKMW